MKTHIPHDVSRRDFLALAGIAALSGPSRAAAPQMTLGCAAITWGGDDTKAIEDVSSVGYKGIQLRASVLKSFEGRPDDLRALLRKRKLTFAVLSSGNLVIDPAVEQEQLALHTTNAEFVRRAHGKFIQVIDERPKGRAVTPQDYTRVGRLLTELGKRTAAAGVPLVYHHHMNSTGERPEEIAAILEAANPAHVGLLFDIAHYHQGGGDPVTAIHTYRNWIKVVHLKDVRPIDTAPGYQWVELGRGRVDVKGCVAALREIGFNGWAIVELDRVTDPGETPRAAAAANAEYAATQLGFMR